MITPENYEFTLDKVSTGSKPSGLKITDLRFADIRNAPMGCTLLKIYTNQGLVGLGEVRDWGSKTYAAMLKSRLLGENPCDVDRLFRRIKQFGGQARQGGGVSGIEVALWDLAGKAYGVPVYQMLGGKFRDRIRVYCDTGIGGKPDGVRMGQALKSRMERGFTFLKMDLGIGQLMGTAGMLSAPTGFLDEFHAADQTDLNRHSITDLDQRRQRNRAYDLQNIPHPFTGIHITEAGLDWLEQYVAQVRGVIGYEIPLAVDHIGHVGLEDCIRLCRRLEKYNLAWVEDLLPWQMTAQYAQLRRSAAVPICTGEDIYLKENFRPLLEAGGVAVIHPDLLTSGGILENKKIGDLAQEFGVAMAIHMAETPVACMAAVHSAAATENFLVLENHSVDIPWWGDLAKGLPKPLIDHGFINVPDRPGLGIEDLDDEVIRAHLNLEIPGIWESTEAWDGEWSHDRLWS
jgi:L-alanine-DL-glutamate epimerase-like enolase superfamily enzyme